MSTSSSGNNPEKIESENKVEPMTEPSAPVVSGTAVEAEKPVPNQPEATTPVAAKHNHKLLYAVIAVLVLLVLGAVGALLVFNPFTKSDTADQSTTKQTVLSLKGEVAIVEGQVEKEVETDTWTAVKVGDTIAEGDTLRTGAEARVVVNLDDGSAVRLDQNSTLAFTKLTNTAITLTQVSGRAYHRVEKGSLVYSVKSLGTTATALGTSFSTSTNTETDSSQVVVLESKVKVTTAEVDDDVQVEEGKVASIDNAKHEVTVDTIDPKTLEEEFYQWNTALNEGKTYVKPTPTPTPEPTQAPTQEVKGLTLSVTPIEGGVKLSWVISGQSAPQGFKVLKAAHANPTFGQDHATYISDPNARSYEWTGFDSKQYYFRIGIYNGSGISWYSNVVAATPLPKPTKAASAPFAGTISLVGTPLATGKAKFTWTATKTETVEGWKLVYSSDANPTYPEDSAVFVNAGEGSYTWSGLPSGTYHFRIGAWIDGKVASNAYSNDITVVVP